MATRTSLTPQRIEVFWSRPDRSGGPDACWPWPVPCPGNYGTFVVDGTPRGVHRIAYQIANGEIPEGMVVRHRCDNPPCCNPAHLELGTLHDNARDMVERERHRFGVRHTHAILDDEKVREIRHLHAEGMRPVEIARRFGIKPPSVHNIVRRRIWRHVA